jgi:hypothetical protein
MTTNQRRTDNDPRTNFDLFTDLVTTFDQTSGFTAATTGTGSTSPIAADDTDHDAGIGIVEFIVSTDGTGSVRWDTNNDQFRGSHSVYMEIRVKLPATPGNIAFEVGFDNESDTSAKIGYSEDDPEWDCAVESGVGADSDSDTATGVTVNAGWQIIRIEVDAGVAARFYVDDSLVTTLGAAGVPEGADEMDFFIAASQATGSAESMFVDWIRIWGVKV